MPNKLFQYETNGLSYEVRISQTEDGRIIAEINVISGHMDVNAVYWGDSTFSGPSPNAKGPLNMNGAQLDGERVQFDGGQTLSQPGLGRAGTSKSTYLTADSPPLVIELDVASIDEIEIFGIRATSTSTPEGSIKGVSRGEDIPDDDDHDDDDDNDDDDDDDDDDDEPETYDKVFFQTGTGGEGDNVFVVGVSIFSEGTETSSPNDYALPEGTPGTLENYLAAFADLAADPDIDWPDPSEVERIVLLRLNEFGELEEIGTIDPVDVGFGLPLPAIAPDDIDTEIDDTAEDELDLIG